MYALCIGASAAAATAHTGLLQPHQHAFPAEQQSCQEAEQCKVKQQSNQGSQSECSIEQLGKQQQEKEDADSNKQGRGKTAVEMQLGPSSAAPCLALHKVNVFYYHTVIHRLFDFYFCH